MEAAKARQAELQKILDTQLTPPGQQELIEQKLKSDGTAVEGKLKGSTAVHPDAPEWRRKTAEGLVKSHLEQQDYEKALAELRQKQDAAHKELPGIEEAIRKAEAKLADIQAKAPPELAALAAKVAVAQDEVARGEEDARTLQASVKGIGEAFRLVEEPVRLKYDVLEWEDDFVRLADLEKVAADLKADISKARDRIAAEAKAAGKPFPADWKPSQQDRLDAVTALIQKVKAAREAKPPAPPPVKTAPPIKPAAAPTAPAKAPR